MGVTVLLNGVDATELSKIVASPDQAFSYLDQNDDKSHVCDLGKSWDFIRVLLNGFSLKGTKFGDALFFGGTDFFEGTELEEKSVEPIVYFTHNQSLEIADELEKIDVNKLGANFFEVFKVSDLDVSPDEADKASSLAGFESLKRFFLDCKKQNQCVILSMSV